MPFTLESTHKTTRCHISKDRILSMITLKSVGFIPCVSRLPARKQMGSRYLKKLLDFIIEINIRTTENCTEV
jgi:hypothetical protein